MQFTRHTFSIVMFSALTTVCVFSVNIYGRSLYAITTCNGTTSSTLTAYNLQGEQIEYPIDTQIDNGAIGLALDPDSETLFATYDADFGGKKIVLINAKTMQKIKSIPLSYELAGIVYDQSEQKIYAVSREYNILYIYLWNPISKSLTLEKDETLENIDPFNGAYGLALDEENKILYVTDKTDTVKYYDSNYPNFSYLGSIDVDETATGIDFYPDGQGNKYLYTGRYSHTSGDHYYLVRTNITDVNNPVSTKKNVGNYVVGIAADRQTGLIYITTWGNRIEVYNNDTFPTDPCYIDANDIERPADIIVRGDVSYKPPRFYLKKVDVNWPNSVVPDNYITYEITYGPNGVDHNNVVITDCLPPQVTYDPDFNWSTMSFDPNYDPNNRTYKWIIPYLPASAPNSTVTLMVQVNNLAEPLGTISNHCEIESDIAYNTAEANTPVGCWGGNIIYVDQNATAGFNAGTSWANAYLDLQDAIDRAAAGCGNQIWVAAGTYRPSKRTNSEIPETATFQLVNGVVIYGGFPTGGGQRNRRTNETILDGNKVIYVVSAQNINSATILDGFTIKNGSSANIKIDNGRPTIANNTIKESNGTSGRGIECNNCEPNITNCVIANNGYVSNESLLGGGIYCATSSPKITNCIFSHNGAGKGGGIYNGYSSPKVTNCIFSKNMAYNYGGGIYNDHSSPTITNCTFSGTNRANYGGGGMCNYYSSSPTVTNCIFWGNKVPDYPDYNEIYNSSSNPVVSYCDIQGGWSGPNNINIDPCFYNPDANDFHLKFGSPCIDKGNNSAVPQWVSTDIDGEKRIIDGNYDGNSVVDIGADEYYRSPDFSKDGIVNFIDYAMFATVWQSTNPQFSLDGDSDVDYVDLAIFCDCNNWLWQADWAKPFISGEGEDMGGDMDQGMSQGLELSEEAYLSIPSEQPESAHVTARDIKEILKHLDEIWLDPEVREVITEDEWLKFVESVKFELK